MNASFSNPSSSCKRPRKIEALYALIWKMSRKDREDLLLQYEEELNKNSGYEVIT